MYACPRNLSNTQRRLNDDASLAGLPLLFRREIRNSAVIVQVPGTATTMSAGDFSSDASSTRAANVYWTFFRNDIGQRLARWILLTHRVDRNEMPLTHEFLSYLLGVRRASVSVAASELASKGLISYTRGVITLLNRQGLENATCACYEIVRGMTGEVLNGAA